MSSSIDFLEDNKSFVALVDSMQHDVALKVTNAARASYDNTKTEFDTKDQKLTKFLWSHEHTSPFRHSYFTFQIKLPLFVARQLMKYQVGSTFKTVEANGEEIFFEEFDHIYDVDKGCSWNEVSGRYTQTSEDYYLPSKLRSNPGHGNKQSSGEYVNPLSPDDPDYITVAGLHGYMHGASRELLVIYHKLVKNGVAKEIARMVLPQNMYTKVYWTMSLQSLIWFLHQRLKSDAQYEIRMLAESMYSLVAPQLTKLGLDKDNL